MKKLLMSLILAFTIFQPVYSEISLQSYTNNIDLIDDYIDMARLYTSSAEYEKALEYINIIDKISPNNPKILYEKAIILKNYNQPILARNLMREVAQMAPEYKDTYLYKDFFKDDLPGFYMPKNYDAQYYQKRGEEALVDCKYEKAAEYFNKALNIKKSVENYNNLGKTYVKLNKPKLALKCFEEAINLDVKNPQTYINLALYYCEIEKDFKKQTNYLKHAIKLNPELAEPYYQMGNAYLDKGMYETAIEYYRLATAKDDLNFDAYFALGSTLYKMGEYEEAYFVLEKSLTLELDNAKVYEYLGKSAIETGKYQEAKSYLKRATAIAPTPDNYLLLAQAMYYNGDYEETTQLLKNNVNDKHNDRMYNYLGLSAFQQNRYYEAINYFISAINISARPVYYYNLAVCYNAIGKPEQVQSYINKALSASINRVQDYLDVIKIYQDLNKPQEILSTVNKAISIYPNERSLYKLKLQILQQMGDTKEFNTFSHYTENKFAKEPIYMGK